MYRYTGTETAVLLIDGASWPVDPRRVYDDNDFVVTSRPDLFIRSAGQSDDEKVEAATAAARVAELEAEVAAQAVTINEGEALGEQLAAATARIAELEAAAAAAQTVTEAPVEQATAAPGEKRTRTHK